MGTSHSAASAANAGDYSGSPHWLLQDFGLLDNMSQAWDRADLGPALGNSLLYAVVSAAAAAVLAGFAAFATIIMPVKRQALWFWVIYSGTLLPLQVFIRPLFLSYAHTSLYDTQTGLVLIYTAIAVPFAFFVMRNYTLTLPRELVETARMDGASWWRVFRQIRRLGRVPDRARRVGACWGCAHALHFGGRGPVGVTHSLHDGRPCPDTGGCDDRRRSGGLLQPGAAEGRPGTSALPHLAVSGRGPDGS